MRRHAVALLALLCGALALALAALWFAPDGKLRNVRWHPPEPRAPDFAEMLPALPARTSADAGRFSETLARPLFQQNRRPPPPPPPVAAAPAALPPPLSPPDALAKVQILGMYEGARGGAIIARVDGKARRLGLNENIGDWTLTAIEGRDVTFTRSGESRVLSLVAPRVGNPKPDAPAAAPAAPVVPVPSSPQQPPQLQQQRPPSPTPPQQQYNPRDARRQP